MRRKPKKKPPAKKKDPAKARLDELIAELGNRITAEIKLQVEKRTADMASQVRQMTHRVNREVDARKRLEADRDKACAKVAGLEEKISRRDEKIRRLEQDLEEATAPKAAAKPDGKPATKG